MRCVCKTAAHRSVVHVRRIHTAVCRWPPPQPPDSAAYIGQWKDKTRLDRYKRATWWNYVFYKVHHSKKCYACIQFTNLSKVPWKTTVTKVNRNFREDFKNTKNTHLFDTNGLSLDPWLKGIVLHNWKYSLISCQGLDEKNRYHTHVFMLNKKLSPPIVLPPQVIH